MCLREGSGAASSSSSPAAMTVTRTSASAELMASDKCVMGELSGPEVYGGSVHERDTVEMYGYIFERMCSAVITKSRSGAGFLQVCGLCLKGRIKTCM